MSPKEELHQLIGSLPEEHVLRARDLLAELCGGGEQRGSNGEGETAPPVEEIAATLAAEVPPEEWERLPADLTDHLDH